MRRFTITAMLCCVMCSPVVAREIAGVALDEQITQADGTVLQLNGAGIRSKFVVKVYIAMLYLENPGNDRDQVIADPGAKQLIMHFLYKEVDKDALVEAWNDGFTGNGTPEQLETLKSEIAEFNGLFDTVKKGDRIVLDYAPGTGTTVSINAAEKGTIVGKEFNDLLLSIWLGDKPVAEKLRKALLGN
ncbi:MAG: chalcone isomerase family protein [Desulfofustis sp.]|nr:chalcone isomerase family protein [Desulfofustis sp.]NNK58794.1 chalcone isomerase family protein [Desulfofustis sp.]